MADDTVVVAKEFRDRGEAELRSLLAGKAEDHHKVKFSHALGQLQETHKLRQLRRDVARLKTLLREREQESTEKK